MSDAGSSPMRIAERAAPRRAATRGPERGVASMRRLSSVAVVPGLLTRPCPRPPVTGSRVGRQGEAVTPGDGTPSALAAMRAACVAQAAAWGAWQSALAGAPEAPEAPDAPDAPEAPEAPEAQAAPQAPASPEAPPRRARAPGGAGAEALRDDSRLPPLPLVPGRHVWAPGGQPVAQALVLRDPGGGLRLLLGVLDAAECSALVRTLRRPARHDDGVVDARSRACPVRAAGDDASAAVRAPDPFAPPTARGASRPRSAVTDDPASAAAGNPYAAAALAHLSGRLRALVGDRARPSGPLRVRWLPPGVLTTGLDDDAAAAGACAAAGGRLLCFLGGPAGGRTLLPRRGLCLTPPPGSVLMTDGAADLRPVIEGPQWVATQGLDWMAP